MSDIATQLQNHEDRLNQMHEIMREMAKVLQTQQEINKNVNERLILLRGGEIVQQRTTDTGESA